VSKGADSFRRVLGCAPTIVARVPLHRRRSSTLATASLIITAGEMGRFERRSDLASWPPPRPDETFTAVPLHDGANSPEGCVWLLGAVCGVLVKNQYCSFC